MTVTTVYIITCLSSLKVSPCPPIIIVIVRQCCLIFGQAVETLLDGVFKFK